MEASWKNHDEVVALLLSRPGIEVNARDEKNYTALHWACYNGSLACLSRLLAVPEVQLNERNSWGNTPIMVAISWGKTEAVRLMAAVAGVDLDGAPTRMGHRPGWDTEGKRSALGAVPAIVQVLEEARQKRRLVSKQKAKVCKVLLDGLHDPESSLNKLREPNDVRRPVMEMIWDQVTEDWQIFDDGGSSYSASCSLL